MFLSLFLYVSYTSAEEEDDDDERCLKTRFYSTGFGAEREQLLLFFFFFSLRGFLSSRISPGAAVGNASLRRSPVLLLEMRLCLTQLERYVNILLWDRRERERERTRVVVCMRLVLRSLVLLEMRFGFTQLASRVR